MPEVNAVRQKCPLCSGERIEIYINAKGGSLAADTLGSSRTNVSHRKILRCRSCQFVFSEFRPADEELHTLYRAMDPTVYEKETSGRRQTAERHLKMMERYISVGNLVDVGCASGSFLAAAVAAGWRVTGVEPSEVLAGHAREALRGCGEVHCSTLQEANLVSASFDALTLWDVLEHVTDPVSFLANCARLLKPEGYLFANVPDINSIQARLFGERWPLLLAEHLNYFSRDTLKLCGEKTGLQWVAFDRRPASFSLEYILLRLSQHRIPASAFGHRMVQRNALGNVNIPIYLGETFAVWTRS